MIVRVFLNFSLFQHTKSYCLCRNTDRHQDYQVKFGFVVRVASFLVGEVCIYLAMEILSQK